MTASTHEDFAPRAAPKRGSDRNFGLVMAAVLAIVAALKLWHAAPLWPVWAAGGIAMVAIALLIPHVLGPLNVVWYRFGLLLHEVIGPVVMAILFFGVVTPIGGLMRLTGYRPLAKSFDREAASYWVPRKTDGPARSMKNQF